VHVLYIGESYFSFQLSYLILEWIWYIKFAFMMFGCRVILVEKCNFHPVFPMVYESIVNDLNGSVVRSGIIGNVNSSVLKVFSTVYSVYFVLDNHLNNYFRSSDFHLFHAILKGILWNITVWNDFWYFKVVYYVYKWFGTLASWKNIKSVFLFRKINVFSHIINCTWWQPYMKN
jgi:hypothetical protein